MSGEPTNKPEHTGPDIRREYDFSGGVRGKYAVRYAQGTNVVLLEPDVAAAFPTSEAVNSALRERMREQRQGGKTGL